MMSTNIQFQEVKNPFSATSVSEMDTETFGRKAVDSMSLERLGTAPVKQEPEWDGEADSSGELLVERVFIKEDVKMEAEEAVWEDSAAAGEEVALASLYAGHEVKDELVLGPEGLQPRDVTFIVNSSAPKIIERPVLRDGVVRLERVLEYEVAAARRGAEPDDDQAPSGGDGESTAATLAGLSTGGDQPTNTTDIPYNSHSLHDNNTTYSQKTDVCKKCLKTFFHSGMRPYYCTHCNHKVKRFQTKRPPKTKPVDLENPYHCGKCKCRFKDEKSLTSHERAHTGKPYSCTVCKKKFMLFCRLVAHERLHTNERPFRCGTCEKSFSWLRCLKSHERTHTGEKPYSCG